MIGDPGPLRGATLETDCYMTVMAQLEPSATAARAAWTSSSAAWRARVSADRASGLSFVGKWRATPARGTKLSTRSADCQMRL